MPSCLMCTLKACLLRSPENRLVAGLCFPVDTPARDAILEAQRAAKPRLLSVRPRALAMSTPAQQASMAAARLSAKDSADAAALGPAVADDHHGSHASMRLFHT